MLCEGRKLVLVQRPHTYTPPTVAWTERLGCGGLRVRTTVLAGETPGGKFLSGDKFLIGAVTVPKLEFNLPWPVVSQPVAIRLWLRQGGDGAGEERCVPGTKPAGQQAWSWNRLSPGLAV